MGVGSGFALVRPRQEEGPEREATGAESSFYGLGRAPD